MRILLTKKSKKKLFDYLIKSNNCKSLKELSKIIKIPFNTMQNWKYISYRYIPEKIIPSGIKKDLKILDSQEDNWGRIKGGKETYKIILEKYGKEELDRRRLNAIKKSRSTIKNIQNRKEKDFSLDINDNQFLELYGTLLGDGWLSKLKYKDKNLYIIGISGNRSLDREYFSYIRAIFKNLLGRDVYIKNKPKTNTIEIYFNHKSFLNWMHKELNFPIGLKKDLEINEKIYSMGFDKMKFVIRGILDTDGCFYFDKTPVGNPYPCINIHMKAPKLINQIYVMLIEQGFKVHHDKTKSPSEQLILKGSIQVRKWMETIGSSNKRNLDKFARVAQPGLEHVTPNDGVAGSIPASGVYI
jgi:hypothetical protein